MPEEYKPAETLQEVFTNVDPTKPLKSGDPRYVDCHEVRGNVDVVEQLFRTIDWSRASGSVSSQLFTGHRGCGKSTELLRLKRRLEEADYIVLYFAADEMLDLDDIVYSDVLIAITRAIYEGFQEQDIKLREETVNLIHEWFAEVVLERTEAQSAQISSDTEASLGLPANPFARVMVKLTGQLKTSTDSKRLVRQQVDPQISQLIDNINLLIEEGTLRLTQKGKRGLVIIVDNLDRIPFRSLDNGERNNHDALYIERGEQLCALECHLVYTVPISMMYSIRGARLDDIFSQRNVLPMLKIKTQQGATWPEGFSILHTILKKRINLDQIFEEAALNRLSEACGGHPRDLMRLVRSACFSAKERYPKPIDEASTRRAIQQLVNDYSRVVPEPYFPLLVEIHRTKSIKNDSDHRSMLHNLIVLEYVNGETPWYDVHPAILELPKFREALNKVVANGPQNG
jgi:hypothetical protein